MKTALLLPKEHWQGMVEHVNRWLPEEACGLLAGPPGRVEAMYPVENALHSPVAYEMDGRQQVDAMIDLEAKGWDILGIFHSHPAGPAAPSQTDVAQAYYPDAVYVILVPVVECGWTARGYEIIAGQVTEVRVEVAE
jgi:proteasome lid subunit RPN8/RPN11